MSGRVWKLGDHTSTDLIAPGRLFNLRSNLPGLAKHVFGDVDPELASKIEPGDEIEVDLAAGVVKNATEAAETSFPPLPPFMRRVLDDGGLVTHIQNHGDFAVE